MLSQRRHAGLARAGLSAGFFVLESCSFSETIVLKFWLSVPINTASMGVFQHSEAALNAFTLPAKQTARLLKRELEWIKKNKVWRGGEDYWEFALAAYLSGLFWVWFGMCSGHI